MLTDVVNPIHSYRFPLGGERWLECEYLKDRDTTGGYKWVFKNGGGMTPDQWPVTLAKALQGLPRFGHHTSRKYSVGKHSLLIARYIRDGRATLAAQALALVHDTPEVLGVGDLNTHLKQAIGHAVRSYEDDLVPWIMGQLGIPYTTADENVVHAVDKAFGATEAKLLGMSTGNGWSPLVSQDIADYLIEDGVYDLADPDTYFKWINTFDRIKAELAVQG